MKSLISLLIVTLLLATASAASTDPFLGKWKLNAQRSSYPAGTCPKSMIIEMTAAERGVRYRSDTAFANGATAQAQYIADYNGKQAAVMGSRGFLLPVSLKRPDPHTVVASYARGMQVIATSRRVVSSDGKTMTITTRSKAASGKSVTTIGIYEKQ